MENKVIQLQKIEKFKNFLGNKTHGLKKCHDLGFNIPKFVALPSVISVELLGDEIFRTEIVAEVLKIIKSEKYAVRSSALIEDGKKHSFAGQFLTKINLKDNELDEAIKEVLTQSEQILKGKLDNFSIIIQEYIVADIAGVTFTRNPDGGREMIIEYGFCEGEKIVSGKIKPKKIAFHWNNQLNLDIPVEFIKNKIIEKFKDLEIKNGFPQDIEWCIKDGIFYILQTRAITTIMQKQYEQIIYLENFLPKNKKYFFEKTEICEISSRPSIVAYDLLNLIYSKNGPVDNIYKKYGINYKHTDFLVIIGNELFIDKEKEIQGLLPAYSCLQGKNFIPKIYKLSKLLPTIKNLFLLNKIKTNNYDALFEHLKAEIEKNNNKKLNLKSALNFFLINYALIFETNLLASLSIKKVNLLLKNETMNFTEILSGHSFFIDLNKYKIIIPRGLTGNSLDLSDRSCFKANEDTGKKINKNITDWWNNMSKYKRELFHARIVEAIIYNRLREFGRWLTIKNISLLRNLLCAYAEKNGLGDSENIFFANLDDILNNKIKKTACIHRRNIYNKYNHFKLPEKLISSIINVKSKMVGVSAGLAGGILQDQKTIEANKNKKEKVILYTEILSPDLTKYFNKIAGIVSNNGGLLSHLAIMARENNIPVIVGFSIKNNTIKLGDHVQIDGVHGMIMKRSDKQRN
ncbi:MAG: PEP/pyruvate-binding domain-containing protein [Candidatus Moraniibacteriota bacterium]